MLLRQSYQIDRNFHLRGDLAAFGKSLHVPSKGGSQSEFIEQRWMKEIGHSTNVLRDLLNQIRVLLRASCRLCAKIRFFVDYLRNVHTHCSEQLPYAIVQFAGYTSSFLVLNLQETRRKLGLLARLLCLLTPGNISCHFGRPDDMPSGILYRPD